MELINSKNDKVTEFDDLITGNTYIVTQRHKNEELVEDYYKHHSRLGPAINTNLLNIEEYQYEFSDNTSSISNLQNMGN